MLSIDQYHIDSEFNGGFSAVGDSELMNLRPNSGQTLLNTHQLQQKQQQQQQQQQSQSKSPTATMPTKHSTLVQSNSNSKKSVMLNFKSGVTINSTVEEFGNFSTRFSDTFTQNRRHYRFWLLTVGVVISCLCCFVFGLSFNYLLGTQPCGVAQKHLRNLCVTENCIRTASSLLSAMNRSVDPCDNFFQYACGAWNKKNIIPEDKSSFSTFEVLADQQQVILRQLLEEPSNHDDNKATIKAKHFYKSCVNITQIRSIGDVPLKELLKYYGGWPVLEKSWTKPNQSLEATLGKMHGELNEHFLVSVLVAPDDKNSSVNILVIDQLILALPSREYYLKDSSKSDLMAYHNYMTKIAIILGADPATIADDMQEVLDFEIQLANASLSEIERHDTNCAYHKLTLASLKQLVPQIKWDIYFQYSFAPETNITDSEPIVVYAVPYLVQLGHLIAETDERIIRNYMLWRMVLSLASHFVDEYQKERIEFQRILLGIKSERHRWSQCVDWTNKKLGMAVGALFIRDNFNSESKESALEMIHTIREAFNELLDENDWMDDETRAVAKEKANSMNERIGYPDILTNVTELEKEYSNLTISEDTFFENILNILKFDSQRQCQMLRKPVEKQKWATEPAVVNAFYNPNRNDIVFPAGILQPLFYSKNFPKSLNYGGIGVVIGHEITHGFDDKGRQFDKDGNMKQWWNNATITAFRDRAQCIIDQYSRYKVNELGVYMNGKLTQSENIADNGGLKQAFRAYKKWTTQHGIDEDLPGLELNHDQLFFLNYAQIWCGSMRPEDALSKLRSSVHSPGVIRVLGPLSNSKEFSDAYKCPSGSPMNPTNKCSVW